ncbi:MAG TPA: TonB-dependent receptor [Accumulibacter sp.]|nr:TonB-dependent receptor [Accumulibacter sp.]
MSSASRFEQKVSKIASSVTVISREEIQQHGWRTLAQALRSVPGFYIHYDRNYDYIGARGFARPQDYNSRILLLIDGYRTNDPLYDQAYVGSEQLLDIDLVERIEVVRGPGSSVYGGNAIFGVVNIITRAASEINGFESAAGWASHHSREGRLTYGRRAENGVELLASLSGSSSDGPGLYFPEYDTPANNYGRTTGTDFDRHRSIFARLSYDGWRLTAAASRRVKGAPSGAYGANFDDPANTVNDTQAYVDLAYQRPLSENAQLSGRLYWGDYVSDWLANYSSPPVFNHDRGKANWWGSEIKLVNAWSPDNQLVSGIEYQVNYRLKQWNYDVDPYQLYLDEQQRRRRFGFFLQNDFQWTDALNVSLGARLDKISGAAVKLTPRLGLVYRSSAETIWKMQYGTAFRTPNAYESHYQIPGFQSVNPDGLAPEKITTYEAGIEHYLSRQTRLAATFYFYKLDGLLETAPDPSGLLQYVNSGTVKAAGIELEAEHQFDNRARLRLSVDLQKTRDAAGNTLTNSPQTVAKFLAWQPLPWFGLQLGSEGQWLSRRKTELGTTVPSYGIVNLTLLKPQTSHGWQFSAGVNNLFDRRYADPASRDLTLPDRDRFAQNGRTFQVKAVFRY